MTTAMIPLAKSRTPDQGRALRSLDDAIDSRLPSLSRSLAGALREFRLSPYLTDELLRDLWRTGSVPRDLDLLSLSAYERAWEILSPSVAGAQLEAERWMGLQIGASAPDLSERGDTLPKLLQASQARAWRVGRRVAREVDLPEEDAIGVLRAIAGLNQEGVVALVKGQAQRVAKMNPAGFASPHFRETMAKRVRASVLRHADELLRRRAYITAEYELARGYNQAKRLAVVQALKVGLIQEVVREWVTQRDEDVCEICRPLHGKTMRARSSSTLYNVWDKERGIYIPPAHMKCRCTEMYRYG